MAQRQSIYFQPSTPEDEAFIKEAIEGMQFEGWDVLETGITAYVANTADCEDEFLSLMKQISDKMHEAGNNAKYVARTYYHYEPTAQYLVTADEVILEYYIDIEKIWPENPIDEFDCENVEHNTPSGEVLYRRTEN